MRDQRIPIVSAEGRNLFMDAFPNLAKHLPVLPRPHVRSHLEDFDHGFPTELAERAHQATLPVLLSGGDEAVYFAAHTDEFFATVRVEPQQPARHLTKNLNQKIGSIKADTLHMGNPTLDEYLQAPESYSQAFVVVHRGEVVYEQYPRMQSGDSHVWMSAAKVTASLLVDLLIEEGRINEDQPIGDYLPDFRGTPTAQVPVKDVLAMSTGLDTEENDASRSDPDSIVSRMFLAEFGMPYQGRVESLVDVLRSAKLSSQPGESFQYSSATTQLLVLLAEAVEAKPWQDIFAERVWAKLGVEQAIQLHQSPDGIVAAHGLISSTLRDLARFGVLYTPSWHKVASERVVRSGVIDRIRESVRSREFFMAGSSGPRFLTHFQDPTILSSSRQWDVVWPDGDFWKGGIMGQGLYISPDKDLVIAYFSVNAPDRSIDRFVRPIATSRWFS